MAALVLVAGLRGVSMATFVLVAGLCGVSMAALVLVAGLRGVSMAALVLVADLRGVAKAMAPALVAYEFLFPHGVPSRRFKSHSVLWDVKIKGSDIYSD